MTREADTLSEPREAALPVVSFDESGNSGQNLLDDMQPVFVLSSVSLEANVAADLVRRAGLGEGELKFSELRVSVDGQRAVERLIADPAITERTARLSYFHKPWMLAAKFVDVLVEPYFAGRGHSMYVGGMHLAMADSLYRDGDEALGSETWTELQRAFIEVMRKPSAPKLERFDRAVIVARQAARHDGIAAMLDAILAQDDLIDAIQPAITKHQLDPAPTALIEQIGFWSNLIGPHHVVHDEAGAIKDWQPHIEALSDPKVEPFEFKIGETTVHYPLQARSITLAVSDDDPAIQVADVLAGAASAVALVQHGARRPDEFTDMLARTGLGGLVGWGLPTPQFAAGSPG